MRAYVIWERQQDEIDAEIERLLGPAPKSRYEALYPSCKSGCGETADGRDGYCWQCASDREWEARRDAAS